MASLVEELIQTLEKEQTTYEELIPVVQKKTIVIIENNLEELQKITDQETDLMQTVTTLEAKRRQVMDNMAIVLNQDVEKLTLKRVIELLDKQPEEQRKLCIIHDNLKQTVQTLASANNQNKSLLEQSLDMIEFNMNFIQSTRMSPGNNYGKGAITNDSPEGQTWMFDAKQ